MDGGWGRLRDLKLPAVKDEGVAALSANMAAQKLVKIYYIMAVRDLWWCLEHPARPHDPQDLVLLVEHVPRRAFPSIPTTRWHARQVRSGTKPM